MSQKNCESEENRTGEVRKIRFMMGGVEMIGGGSPAETVK